MSDEQQDAKRPKLEQDDNDEDETSSSIAVFPDEVLLRIFSFLPRADVAVRLPLVCKRFRKISADPTLWTKLTLDRTVGGANYCPTDKALDLLKRCTLLADLTISNDPADSNDLSVCAIKSSPALRRLDLRRCQPISPDLLKAIAWSHRPDPRDETTPVGLRSLCLHKTGFEPVALHAYWHHDWHTLRYLRTIDLCGYDDDDDEEEYETVLNHSVAAAIGDNCERLEACHLTYGVIGEEAFDRLVIGISGTIKTFSIRYGDYPATFHRFLSRCKLLEVLRIPSGSFIDGEALSSITDVPKLRVLDLDGLRNLGTVDFAVAFGGKRLESLQVLSVNRCKGLGNEAMSAVAEACPNLVDLAFMTDSDDPDDLPCDDGVRSVLTNCRKLRRLKFWSCGVTWEPLFELVPSMQRQLEYLRLYLCESIWKSRDEAVKVRELILLAPRLRIRVSPGGRVMCRDDDESLTSCDVY